MLTFAYAGTWFVSQRKRISKPASDDVSCQNSRAERVTPLMNGREFTFQRVLLSLGLEESARGVFRDVVELAVREITQISRITNAVTDRDAVILKSDIADPLDPLPSFGTIHLHISSSRRGFVLRDEGVKDRHLYPGSMMGLSYSVKSSLRSTAAPRNHIHIRTYIIDIHRLRSPATYDINIPIMTGN
jgi:hypothetical protein